MISHLISHWFEPSPNVVAMACEPQERSASVEGTPQLESLFNRFSRLVFVTAYRVLGDVSEAEDIVQEVFLYIHRKPQLFDPAKGTVRAWMVRLALCRSLDRKLYLSRHGFYTESSLEFLQLAERTSLEKQVEINLCRQEIDQALHSLSSLQRRTIECFYFEELDLRTISERLRQPLGNVRHHLYRGLNRLRNNIAPNNTK